MTQSTICCIATGPSVTPQQVDVARRKGFTLFACNDAFRLAPDCALVHGCNYQWWARRHEAVRDLPAEKWTTNAQAAAEFGLNWIAEKLNDGSGLSHDPSFLYHGHGSGFQLLGMAWRARPERIVLLGYDMAFAPDYDGRSRNPGSSPRHFFGEYEPELQHWPSKMVEHGRHIELLRFYQHVADQSPCEIINCSGGVMDCFPRMPIDAVG
jgi:hypothetical protein